MGVWEELLQGSIQVVFYIVLAVSGLYFGMKLRNGRRPGKVESSQED